MIDFARKIVFIHLSKTRGTAIEAALLGDPRLKDHSRIDRSEILSKEYGANFLQIHHPHHRLSLYRKSLGQDFSQYTIFTVVRNIYQVELSRFFYHTRGRSEGFYTSESFLEFLHYYPNGFTFRNLIGFKDEPLMHYILDFNNLESDFSRMLSELKLPHASLEIANKTNYGFHRLESFFSTEVCARIEKLYHYDIVRFGWTREANNPKPKLFQELTPETTSRLHQIFSKQSETRSSSIPRKAFRFALQKLDRRTITRGTTASVLRSKFFAKRPDVPQRIFASLATHSPRLPYLRYSVESLLPQVDVLYIYLNNVSELPRYLKHPKIRATLSTNALGDLKSNGKYYGIESEHGYHLIVDDDIIYPEDFAARMIAAVERYQRKSLVGAHVSVLRYPVPSYYLGRIVLHFEEALANDISVDIVSAGTACYHTDSLTLSLDDFPETNCDDLYLSIKAHRKGLSLIAVARQARWLKGTIPPQYDRDSIFQNNDNYEKLTTRLIVENWELFFDKPRPHHLDPDDHQ